MGVASSLLFPWDAKMFQKIGKIGQISSFHTYSIVLEVIYVPLLPNEAVVGTTPMTEFETLVKAEVVTGLAFTTSKSFRVGGAVPTIYR